MATAYTTYDKLYLKQEGEFLMGVVHFNRMNATVSDTFDMSYVVPDSMKVINLVGIDHASTVTGPVQATGTTTITVSSYVGTSLVVSTGVVTFASAADSTDFYLMFTALQ